MAIKAIAHSYWRRIRDGARKFEDTPESVKSDVFLLAREAVEDGTIDKFRFQELVGEEYEE